MNFAALPTWNAAGVLHVVVESPRGSSLKLKWDQELGTFTVSRPLVRGLTYPYDWGFVPSTAAADGDPLDAMVLCHTSGYPGLVWACQPIGVVRITQPRGTERVHNDRVLAVPVNAPEAPRLGEPNGLTTRERAELEEFFRASVVLDKQGVEIVGWGDAAEARAVITSSSRK